MKFGTRAGKQAKFQKGKFRRNYIPFLRILRILRGYCYNIIQKEQRKNPDFMGGALHSALPQTFFQKGSI